MDCHRIATPCRVARRVSILHQRTTVAHPVPARLRSPPRAVQVEFNDQFKAVLAGALSRQDEDEPSSSYEPSASTHAVPTAYPSFTQEEEVHALSMQEETLRTALGSSRATLTQLKQIRAALDRAIEREEKQMERLEFAASKAHTDAAYYAMLEKRSRENRSRRSWRE